MTSKMKKVICTLILILTSTLWLSSCAQNSTKDNNMKLTDKKILVVFFSRTGENYAVGNITKGNTHIVAELIADITGGELCEIVPEKAYPKKYDACVEIAQKEKETSARPAIKGNITVENHDIIFVGYPNWWGDMPMPVYTFIDKNKWNGKTVIPFCTHEGSGLSDTETRIAEACKGATVRKGLAIKGYDAQNGREKTRKYIQKWIDEL